MASTDKIGDALVGVGAMVLAMIILFVAGVWLLLTCGLC